MPLQGLPQACLGHEPCQVVPVDSSDLAVGPSAQLQDGDNAAQVVKSQVSRLSIIIRHSSLMMGRPDWQEACVSGSFGKGRPSCVARYGHRRLARPYFRLL